MVFSHKNFTNVITEKRLMFNSSGQKDSEIGSVTKPLIYTKVSLGTSLRYIFGKLDRFKAIH